MASDLFCYLVHFSSFVSTHENVRTQQMTAKTAYETSVSQFGQGSDTVHKGGKLLQQTEELTVTHHDNDMEPSCTECLEPAVNN